MKKVPITDIIFITDGKYLEKQSKCSRYKMISGLETHWAFLFYWIVKNLVLFMNFTQVLFGEKNEVLGVTCENLCDSQAAIELKSWRQYRKEPTSVHP